MGNIPLVTSRIDASSGRSNPTLGRYATPDEMGASVGRALQSAGGQVGELANSVAAYQDKKRKETVNNKIAQGDFTPQELQSRNEVGPDGKGLADLTLGKFDAWVEQQANELDDDQARAEFRIRMAAERNNVSKRAWTEEFSLDATYSKQQADASLISLRNKALSDPDGFEGYVKTGQDVIGTRDDMPAAMRNAMQEKFRLDMADARFTGLLERAKTPEELDVIAAELTASPKTTAGGKDDYVGRDWSKDLTPENYSQLINKIGVARKEMITKADADARAAIGTIEERAKDVNVRIPKEEMDAVGATVKMSRNPVTIAKFARIVRDQKIFEEASRLPLAEQDAAINGLRGDPSSSAPGVPARVSNAINKAAGKFGVSASYLAMTAKREYGQFFKRTVRETDSKFAPVGIHKGVDVRNFRPDVQEAFTVAGQAFGEPIQLTSGYRSQAKQNSIRMRGNPNRVSVAKHSQHTEGQAGDISTVGMSPERKGQLVAALVDAGFTGIGEYDTHIHADFRGAVPQSFGEKDGKFWGGWTYLSEPVRDALVSRGAKAGASAKDLRRAAAVQFVEDIDYGQGTTITRDDGRPTSSAIGVGQFTEGTFLSVMKNPAVSGRIGVDTSGMSDDQILELRKDPDVSIMAMAALGEIEKNTMEGTLGRTVNDAEVYMAHFLGSPGAIALLKAKEATPGQLAADLLPKQANANKPVFYKNGKALTVEQLYNNISNSFVASPDYVEYGDLQTRQKVRDNTEKRLKDEPMDYARETGTHDVPDLTDDNVSEYGNAVRSVAEYYNLPLSDMKVLDDDALASMKRTIEEGDADQVLDAMSALQGMGADLARVAYKQIGQTDDVYAYAAGLNLDTGDRGTAGDIVRGQKRLTENPELKNDLDEATMKSAFRTATGNALNEVSPALRSSIEKAALAHYVETNIARGKTDFDPDAYALSVRKVIGGKTNNFDEVNGETTVLPEGISGDQMESAMAGMTTQDWAQMSRDGMPPRYRDGSLIDPTDLANEARLRPIGGNQYKVQLDDGTFAVNGNTDNGRMEVYVFQPDVKRLLQIEATPGNMTDTYLPAPEEAKPFTPEAVNSAFDEYGRWLGPKK